jgi:hypothetical protein
MSAESHGVSRSLPAPSTGLGRGEGDRDERLDLRPQGLLSQSERASFRVLADRPCLPRMDHDPTQRLDPLKRLGDVAHGEVGQREGIAGATAAGMDADRGGTPVRLPALSLSISASLQLRAEERGPETSGALEIVGGELDE